MLNNEETKKVGETSLAGRRPINYRTQYRSSGPTDPLAGVKSPDQVEKSLKETVLAEIKPIQNGIRNIVSYLNDESKKKLSTQAFVGEAVLYELLRQSYGMPEYSSEERLKRLCSVVTEAIKNSEEAPNCGLSHESLFDDTPNYGDITNNANDPHSLKTIEPNTGNVVIRRGPTACTEEKQPLDYIWDKGPEGFDVERFNENPCNRPGKITPPTIDIMEVIKRKREENKEIEKLDSLWKKPEMGGSIERFNQFVPVRPVEKTQTRRNFNGAFSVQINGKFIYTAYGTSTTNEEGLINLCKRLIRVTLKKRKKAVKKVICSGNVVNFIV